MDAKSEKASTRANPAGARAKSGSPVRFVLMFVGLLILFELLWEFAVAPSRAFQSYLALNARLSAAILSLLESNVSTKGNVILSSRHSLGIARGCDALQPMGIFLSAVLAFPAAWRSKWVPMLVGASTLLFVNQLRIVSLYFLGIGSPTAFEVFHEAVWPAAFILLAFAMWILWVRRLRPEPVPRT